MAKNSAATPPATSPATSPNPESAATPSAAASTATVSTDASAPAMAPIAAATPPGPLAFDPAAKYVATRRIVHGDGFIKRGEEVTLDIPEASRRTLFKAGDIATDLPAPTEIKTTDGKTA